MFQFLLWSLATLIFALLSRRALCNPGCHGFYRFFAFATCAAVVIPNVPYWLRDPMAMHQLLSWLLLFAALALLVSGLYLLKTRGGRRSTSPTENFSFENTGTLVDTGIFQLVRHPMYSALILFTWGVWLKDITWPGLALSVVTTLSLWMTARIEERENLRFFGDSYQQYSKRTKSFIPYIF